MLLFYLVKKLDVKEIPLEEFSYDSVNKFQSLYRKQCLEIELYLLCVETEKWEQAFLTFEYYYGFSIESTSNKECFSRKGYVSTNNIIQEFVFALFVEDGVFTEIQITYLNTKLVNAQ